jgi:hypothetical protein
LAKMYCFDKATNISKFYTELLFSRRGSDDCSIAITIIAHKFRFFETP